MFVIALIRVLASLTTNSPMSQERALQIALGNLNFDTNEVIDHFDPYSQV